MIKSNNKIPNNYYYLIFTNKNLFTKDYFLLNKTISLILVKYEK